MSSLSDFLGPSEMAAIAGAQLLSVAFLDAQTFCKVSRDGFANGGDGSLAGNFLMTCLAVAGLRQKSAEIDIVNKCGPCFCGTCLIRRDVAV